MDAAPSTIKFHNTICWNQTHFVFKSTCSWKIWHTICMYCYWLISYSNGNRFDHVYFLAEYNLIRVPHYGFVDLSHTVLNMHSSVGTTHTASTNASTCLQEIFSKGTTWYSDVIWASSCFKSPAASLFVQQLVPSDNKIPNSTLRIQQSVRWITRLKGIQ